MRDEIVATGGPALSCGDVTATRHCTTSREPPIDATARGGAAPRLVALYLPQFHPIPENDAWWGKGFTEWTNTAKARPMFRGHYQPHVPADLGYYDLRVPETRAAQADMARAYGIDAFCYYHYWFSGRSILQRPFDEVLNSREPHFPFCLCWANQSWTGIWHGSGDRILIKQEYPGDDDHRAHFAALLPAFLDERYLRVDGKPFFVIYRPMDIPDIRRVADLWREMAISAGLGGLHLVGVETDSFPDWDHGAHGFDASFRSTLPPRREWRSWRTPFAKIEQFVAQRWQDLTGVRAGRSWQPTIHRYRDVALDFVPPPLAGLERYPCVVPNWDNTPRSGRAGLVLHDSAPEQFRLQLRKAFDVIADLPATRRIVIVKSWNEWAEGNHLEPDLRYGRGYLEVVKQELMALQKAKSASSA
jgi:hypothetical protein